MKRLLSIVLLLMLCASVLAIPPLWKPVGDGLLPAIGDSIGVVSGTDTVWFTVNGIVDESGTSIETDPTLTDDTLVVVGSGAAGTAIDLFFDAAGTADARIRYTGSGRFFFRDSGNAADADMQAEDGFFSGAIYLSTTLNLGAAVLDETELLILDGATLTTIELNYVDGVTSAIQTQLNGKLADQAIGIADDNLVEIDGVANDNEYARFTADGIEGRNYSEMKSDLDLEIGTDVQAYSEYLDSASNGAITINFDNHYYPWADNEVADNITITHADSAAALGPAGATSGGQVLKWDGDSWEAGADNGTALTVHEDGGSDEVLSVDTFDFTSGMDVQDLGAGTRVTVSVDWLTRHGIDQVPMAQAVSPAANLIPKVNATGDSVIWAADETGGAGTGDIDSVFAGAGLTGTAGAGPVTLNVRGAGGIVVEADTVKVDTAGAGGVANAEPLPVSGNQVYDFCETGQDYLKTSENADLTTEQLEDTVGAMFSGNTETRATVTYQDADGTIDIVVDDMNDDQPDSDSEVPNAITVTPINATTEAAIEAVIEHDALGDYVANEHIDWTGASAGTIDPTNYADNNTQLTEEQVEDFAGSMLGGTETGIAVTYQDGTNDIDFVVSTDIVNHTLDSAEVAAIADDSGFVRTGSASHDGFSDFVANEHIDWTGDQGATNIHAGNYPESDTLYTADFNEGMPHTLGYILMDNGTEFGSYPVNGNGLTATIDTSGTGDTLALFTIDPTGHKHYWTEEILEDSVLTDVSNVITAAEMTSPALLAALMGDTGDVGEGDFVREDGAALTDVTISGSSNIEYPVLKLRATNVGIGAGQFYFDTTTNQLYAYNDATDEWVTFDTGATGGGSVTPTDVLDILRDSISGDATVGAGGEIDVTVGTEDITDGTIINEDFASNDVLTTSQLYNDFTNDGFVDVSAGGTGLGTLTNGGILLGSGTGDVTPMSVLANGSIVIGDGVTDPTTLAAFTSSTGDLRHEAGGLEADVSAYDGLVSITGGATAEIDTKVELEARLSDVTSGGFALTTGDAFTGDINMGTNLITNAQSVAADSVLADVFKGSADVVVADSFGIGEQFYFPSTRSGGGTGSYLQLADQTGADSMLLEWSAASTFCGSCAEEYDGNHLGVNLGELYVLDDFILADGVGLDSINSTIPANTALPYLLLNREYDAVDGGLYWGDDDSAKFGMLFDLSDTTLELNLPLEVTGTVTSSDDYLTTNGDFRSTNGDLVLNGGSILATSGYGAFDSLEADHFYTAAGYYWTNSGGFTSVNGGMDVMKATCDSLVVTSAGDASVNIADGLIYDSSLAHDEPKYFTVSHADPNGLYDIDAEWPIEQSTVAAITITSIDVTLDADPTTELEFSLKFADAFIGFANATVIDDTATVAGVTAVSGGFGDATVPASKCVYILYDADPDEDIKSAHFKIGYTLD